jgi:hypothetical protein
MAGYYWQPGKTGTFLTLFNMQIKGIVKQVLPIVTGQGKNGQWSKLDFILETPGQYPKNVCISLWGQDLIDKYDLEPGITLTAHISLESREYNGRWYTQVNAFKIEWDQQQARKWQPGNQQTYSGIEPD